MLKLHKVQIKTSALHPLDGHVASHPMFGTAGNRAPRQKGKMSRVGI